MRGIGFFQHTTTMLFNKAGSKLLNDEHKMWAERAMFAVLETDCGDIEPHKQSW